MGCMIVNLEVIFNVPKAADPLPIFDITSIFCDEYSVDILLRNLKKLVFC